jgi:hypothetical protein
LLQIVAIRFVGKCCGETTTQANHIEHSEENSLSIKNNSPIKFFTSGGRLSSSERSAGADIRDLKKRSMMKREKYSKN